MSSLLGEGTKDNLLFVLVNGQEVEKGIAKDPMPVLLFGLNIGENSNQLHLLGSLEPPRQGLRRVRLLRESGVLLIWYFMDKKATAVYLSQYGGLGWKTRQIEWNSIGPYIARNSKDDKFFLVDDEQENGKVQAKPINYEPNVLCSLDFDWDHIVIPSNPYYAIERNPSFLIVYDKESSHLAKFSGKKLFPLYADYPQKLVELLSGLELKKQLKKYNVLLVRNDKGQRLIECYNWETKEWILFAFDFEKKIWRSLTFSGMSSIDIDSWLCLRRKNAEKGVDFCDNIFYSLPDLRECFRWKSPPDWELLSMEDGLMLYRIDDGIWCADYGNSGISNCRVLAKAPYLRGVHWAMRLPSGSLGNPLMWQPFKLCPAKLKMRDVFEKEMEYFVPEPPKVYVEEQRPQELNFTFDESAMRLVPSVDSGRSSGEPHSRYRVPEDAPRKQRTD